MSSSIHIYFRNHISTSAFMSACKEHELEFQRNVIGHNTFSKLGVEVILGKAGSDSGEVKPPENFKSLVVSTLWLGDLQASFEVASTIMNQWDCKIEADPEFSHLLSSLPTGIVSYYDEDSDVAYADEVITPHSHVVGKTAHSGSILSIETNLSASSSCLQINHVASW